MLVNVTVGRGFLSQKLLGLNDVKSYNFRQIDIWKCTLVKERDDVYDDLGEGT